MALSGSMGTYGIQFSAGVRAAFEEVNRAGGVVGGYNLSLLALDDQYIPANTVENMNNLTQRGDIFGIVGVIGTATSIAALPIAIEKRCVPTQAFTPFQAVLPSLSSIPVISSALNTGSHLLLLSQGVER
jgi:branched-chain amino acid transport system substrate-binding protein